MSDEDRDNAQTREGIDKTAQNWRDLNRKMGNPISQEQARDRVSGARARGDRIRENGNR